MPSEEEIKRTEKKIGKWNAKIEKFEREHPDKVTERKRWRLIKGRAQLVDV